MKVLISNFTEIRPVAAALIQAGRRKVGQAAGQDEAKKMFL
jgi:hypothetical protein